MTPGIFATTSPAGQVETPDACAFVVDSPDGVIGTFDMSRAVAGRGGTERPQYQELIHPIQLQVSLPPSWRDGSAGPRSPCRSACSPIGYKYEQGLAFLRAVRGDGAEAQRVVDAVDTATRQRDGRADMPRASPRRCRMTRDRGSVGPRHDELTRAMADLDKQEVLTLVRQRLDAGHDALAILEACRQGVTIVGERFQQGEYFVSELIFSANIFEHVAQMIEPGLPTARAWAGGAVVIGTVKGDIHSIGKNVVAVLLRAAGYTVHDLGVDVPPQRFIEALQDTGAGVLGLSALLTPAFRAMKATVEAVDAGGLRSRVKVMIGGGPVDDRVRQFTGADAWGANAQSAVDLCSRWLERPSGA